jgi:hydroxypyruvate isomerase
MMRFAPHLGLTSTTDGLFVHHAGSDPLRQIDFIAERGFAGVEDNYLQNRPPDMQVRIGEALARRGLTMGCFLATLTHDRPTFAMETVQVTELLTSELRRAIETAKRAGGRSLTMILGRSQTGVPRKRQLTFAAENLKICAELAERAGVILLIEPIARARWSDILVSRVDEAVDLCRQVGSSFVKILFDVYQCQRETGNLVDMLDFAWRYVGAIQIADCPGRCEPGTGEINFANLLRHIHSKNWDGLIELEHSASIRGRAGEEAVLDVCARLSDVSRPPAHRQANDGHVDRV